MEQVEHYFFVRSRSLFFGNNGVRVAILFPPCASASHGLNLHIWIFKIKWLREVLKCSEERRPKIVKAKSKHYKSIQGVIT